jgi:hypothetical protein
MLTPTVWVAVALRRVLIRFLVPPEIQGFARSAPGRRALPDAARLLVRSVTPRAGRAAEAVPVNPRGLKDRA